MMSKLIAAVSFAALALAVTSSVARAEEEKTIAGIVAGSKDHTVLLALVKEAGLVDTLSGKGEWTVFAPTDAAFKKIDEETLKKVKGDKELLKKILLSHAVKGTVLAADVVKLDGKDVETLSGAKFTVHVDGKTVKIGDAKVTATDLKASNGVVHVIDTVLLPK
ncbi:fasciclin domain-containing protein [Frigoriglobus tundricola]|uniref:FAS1 domain-containing protein n=1 Tax=Frigoriglobus tundricola TaxID=2774151 RepID=A0A6M5YQI6_9BACT|nr:fasciclin domain-containing protein [Frigoriglobus tundricola]QJW95563.1 FAS1 domain-containing protein [Frigoriglobus tundricola]